MTYLIRHGWLNKEGAKTFALMEGYINGTSKVNCVLSSLILSYSDPSRHLRHDGMHSSLLSDCLNGLIDWTRHDVT